MTFTEYNLNLKKVRENQKYDFRLKDALISKMASNKLYFDSIKARTLFIETIK